MNPQDWPAGEDVFEPECRRMVEEQIAGRGLLDPALLQAIRSVPRHRFVPPENRHLAYADCPLPIGGGQTISQPYIVALMTSLLVLEGDENVLEVGAGSGYQAAVLACMARQVHTIEYLPELAARAARVLADLNITGVTVHTGDGSLGLAEFAPYDAILVAAAAPAAPQALLAQLADGGRLVIPVGGRNNQSLQRWVRQGERFEQESLIPVAFVPLRGRHGWSVGDW